LKSLALISLLVPFTLLAQIRVPADHATISAAISAASSGDTIRVSPGTYAESVVVNKRLTIIGNDTTVVITPPAGNGISLAADSIVLRTVKVFQSPGSGLTSSGRKGVVLQGVVSRGNTGSGAIFTNTQGLMIVGGSFSGNLDEGLNISGGRGVTLTDVAASGNGTAGDGSGINLAGVAERSVVTNATVRFNRRHGISISNGSVNVTISGGNFGRNGTSRTTNGGGIVVNAETATVDSVTVTGNVVADSNATAGVWVTGAGGGFVASRLSIGQAGVTRFRGNGAAGVLLYGAIDGAVVSGLFVRNATANAAGVLIMGTSASGANSPQGVSILSSDFSGGYRSDRPAITLSSGAGQKCTTNVLADGNRFQDALAADSIESLIVHKPDEAVLGTIVLTNSAFLPVELSRFEATVEGTTVRLRWRTETEVQNYGFEIQRIADCGASTSLGLKLSNADYQRIGFVPGAGTSTTPKWYEYSDEFRLPIDHSPFSILPLRFTYRLKQLDLDGTAHYSRCITVELKTEMAANAALEVYPNPFNPETRVFWSVPDGGPVTLTVYAIHGEEVARLWQGEAEAGRQYALPMRGESFASGVYFVRLMSGTSSITRRLLMIR
jgi:hypothetical protein